MDKLSRRSFLKGSAAGAMGVAATGLFGSALTVAASESETELLTEAETAAAAITETKYCNGYDNADGIGIASDEVSATEQADIVVVGSGIAGFMAAMIAKEQGPDLNVILLEKNGYYGGSTLLAECNGPATVKTEAEARQTAASHLSSTNYIANPMLWYEQALDAGYNSAWLFGKHNVGYYNAGVTFYEGGNGTIPINQNLAPDCEALGVEMRPSNRAKALIMEDEYTCKGVQVIDADGNVYAIEAGAVILCTGGMSTNKELLSYYSSQDMEKIIGWGVGQDGDGHLMAEQTAHGRANHLTVSSLFNNVEGYSYDSPLGVAATMQYTDLFVNEDGVRFCDESQGGSLGTAESGKLIEGQGYVWSIMDQSMVEKYEAGGCTRHYSGFADACVGAELDLQTEIASAIESDLYTYQADTIEELAELIGVDAETLATTVANYNSYAASGSDEEWGKAADYLWACDTAPYYAFRVSSGMLNTNGGIRINTNAQVVDARYNPIAGLYAAGVCTSGWDGELYGGGSCQTVGMWGGSKAARHALETIFGIEVAEDWYGELLDNEEDQAPSEENLNNNGGEEGPTEAGSEASTEAETESLTEAASEMETGTEAETEAVTEAITEDMTEAVTEAITE
ncbi:MAG: FAD-binding protein [Clostridiales bacterium]|nr:FAD-binding protein [Clostridiales bacterium]